MKRKTDVDLDEQTTEPRKRTKSIDYSDLIFDSISNCSSVTGIPKSILLSAKRNGCPAFRNQRVYLLEFLQWWFNEGIEDENNDGIDWAVKYKRALALREEIKLAEDQKKLVKWDSVEYTLKAAMSLLFGSLDRIFCQELPPILKGLDEVAIRCQCQDEIEKLKTDIKNKMQNLENFTN